MSGYDRQLRAERFANHNIPVHHTSSFWVDGFAFDGEIRSRSMRSSLQDRAALSSPDDCGRVVIMRNLILLFRLVNFYLAFVDCPEFMARVSSDIGWPRRECENIINRYRAARMFFDPQPRNIPRNADQLTALLCRLVDNYIEASRWPIITYDWTASREEYFSQVRQAWLRATQTDVRAILDAPPNLPAPPPFPDWTPDARAARRQAGGNRRSLSPLAQPQQEEGRHRRFRSRSPIRRSIELSLRARTEVQVQHHQDARVKLEAEHHRAREEAGAQQRQAGEAEAAYKRKTPN